MKAGIADEIPETLTGAIRYFANADKCHEFLSDMRWPNGITCPRCGSDKVGALVKGRRVWNCKGCKKQFSVKVGTIFEDSPLGLEQWLPATWMIVNAKNGISSCELHRALGVTQKTAWFMLHRIRLAMQEGSIEKMKGRVEADETFIGGKARYMHADRREKMKNLSTGGKRAARGSVGKTAVMGLLERNSPEKSSRVHLRVVDSVRRNDLDPEIRKRVEKGSEIHTDKLRSYEKLADEYIHQVIDHAESYVNGHVHTNGLENFWSLLKRGIKGTYVSVEPFHLFRYLDEQSFRFNERKDNDKGRFLKAIASFAGKRLMYSKLIGQEDGGLLPA